MDHVDAEPADHVQVFARHDVDGLELGVAAAPAGGPIAQPNHPLGKAPDQNPPNPAEKGRHDDVEQIAKGPLKHVGVGAAQSVEAVGSLGADGAPHQRKAKEHAQQQDGHSEAGHKHKRPQASREQKSRVGFHDQAKHGNHDRHHHHDADSHGQRQHRQFQRGEVGGPFPARESQGRAKTHLLVGGQPHGSRSADRRAEKRPYRHAR